MQCTVVSDGVPVEDLGVAARNAFLKIPGMQRVDIVAEGRRRVVLDYERDPNAGQFDPTEFLAQHGLKIDYMARLREAVAHLSQYRDPDRGEDTAWAPSPTDPLAALKKDLQGKCREVERRGRVVLNGGLWTGSLLAESDLEATTQAFQGENDPEVQAFIEAIGWALRVQDAAQG